MSGNFRSGRKSTKAGNAIVPSSSKPKMPAKLTRVEREFWKSVIAPAKHLSVDDEALARSCCELWGLYRAAYELAKASPCSKELRISVTNYFASWKSAMERLALDPLGRMRAKPSGKPDDVSPLEEFGIVG